MSAWTTGKVPTSVATPFTQQQQQAILLQQEQNRRQQEQGKIASEAAALVKKVEAAISSGGGTPQADKNQFNYGVKGKYLDSVVSAACGLWSQKGAAYSYRGKSWKKDWNEYQTNFEKTDTGNWNHNVHVSHAS